MSLTKHPLPALGMPCIAAVVLLLHGCDMPTEATATDPCASVECAADQVCSSGACYDVANPCDLTECAEGQYCSNGACYDVALRPDPACLGVRYPDGFACVAGECYEVADSGAFAFAVHEDKVEGTLLDEEGVIDEELVMDAPVQ